MQLSEHFSLAEALASEVATRLQITNDGYNLANLRTAAAGMESVRALFGNKPITPSSWYRCPALNTAVGGSKTSHHMTGLAVDFNCLAFGTPEQQFKTIKNSRIIYDQLIWEKVGSQWIHISFTPSPRMQAIVYDGRKYTNL